MRIKDVMTTAPSCCKPTDTLDKVGKLMRDHDCGEIPVCDGSKLVGVITDRDITCRAVALGMTPVAVPARDVMSRPVFTIRETDDVGTALDIMQDALVRRLPVVDANGAVVGIVSQADLVARAPALRVALALRNVSRKTRHRPMAAL